MRKVAHYSPVYLSLTKTWLYAQVAHLKRFEPIVLCRRTENVSQFPVKEIFSFRDSLSSFSRRYYRWRHGKDPYLRYYESVMKAQRPVLIHAHFGNCGHHILPLAERLDLPLVTSFYGYDVSHLTQADPVWIERYKELFHGGKIFIVEGAHMGRMLESLGCPPEKIRIVRLGIDLARIPYRERAAENEIRILAAGSFREKKGHPFAIEAVGRIAQKHRNVSFTIIGDAAEHIPREAAEKKKILAAIGRPGLSGRVRLLGYQPYDVFIRELYEHHIFISPSVNAADGDNEGGAPVSIIEASASGMPIVSTKHCDIPEVVLDGVSGLLVAERDTEALADRLDHLCSHPDLWREMGLAGRKHIEEDYDIHKQIPKLEDIYEYAASGRIP
ncbi:MAG: glycosyltransferase [Candidatus Abyssobacteria bacterium SURF_17]|uniref:Glycosyltransferase n=1 Tax=Candidatus Abyssobacteria bacterium SURF_17 TaxID=2093361 RepID=A0A419F023_9BACT|nr:MAG: glycosyltransferase [Candidatus Abyssubacteria bacterium SURF_17]